MESMVKLQNLPFGSSLTILGDILAQGTPSEEVFFCRGYFVPPRPGGGVRCGGGEVPSVLQTGTHRTPHCIHRTPHRIHRTPAPCPRVTSLAHIDQLAPTDWTTKLPRRSLQCVGQCRAEQCSVQNGATCDFQCSAVTSDHSFIA